MNTMGSSLYFFILMHFFFFLSCSNFIKLAHSSSALQQLCHDDESSALLQFKQSFFINKYASQYCSSAYPKVLSWSLEGENGNCCSWDGVECDNHTGHVIGLDLSCSLLYGSINSSSTLFRLVHLQSLDLSFNHFNYSQIPSEIRNLAKLKSLNLSGSSFFGQVPSELLELPKLALLDLHFNVDPFYRSLLKLEKPSLSNLVENLTNLQVLGLNYVNISSTVPETMANLSSLSALYLQDCGLFGNFPSGIFSLPNLRNLSVRFNPYLTGYLPEFQRGSLMEILVLTSTSFTGKLPKSIGNLEYLKWLDMRNCQFSGQIPFSIGNLEYLKWLDMRNCQFSGQIPFSIGNLINLTYFDLSANHFTGEIPSSLANLTQLHFLLLAYNNFSSGTWSWIGKQTKLVHLQLQTNNLFGVIPYCLQNMTQLTYLDLSDNHLIGEIPSWLGNLTQLTVLGLYQNGLRGPIPKSIFKLSSLTTLVLHSNNLNGTMEVEMFLMFKNLTFLELGSNKLSLITTGSINGTLPQVELLGLVGCNLSEFPKFLRYQSKMQWLNLCGNNLRGHIPNWVWNIGKRTLISMDLSSNFLTGEIPPLICKLSSLSNLDLSNNSLNGTLPQCMSNFSDSLSIMVLRDNSFQGTIPQPYNNRSNLKLIDLSQNHLEGPVPRSLANCKMLEYLYLGNNKFNDIFPFWLGTIPEMKILDLKSNQFHGEIEGPLSKFDFPKLKILDLSWNGFSGELPLKYFQIWSEMKVQGDIEKSNFLETPMKQPNTTIGIMYYFSNPMRITNKGAHMFYSKMHSYFKAVDLSGNKFKGSIPELIGVLKGLQLLNLSNNALTGLIPTSLGNLTALESLDLSQNELSGHIPEQLVQLTFLAVFNVSHNHLSGPIPQGGQFGTFENNSFDGNSGLCGEPLSKNCGNAVELPSPTSTFEVEDSDFPSKLDWIIISLGYLGGTVVGVIFGNILTKRYHFWFVRKFGKTPKWKRAKKGGQRN